MIFVENYKRILHCATEKHHAKSILIYPKNDQRNHDSHFYLPRKIKRNFSISNFVN